MNIPSIPEHEAPPQLHSGSTVVSLDQTEPFGATAGSDGRDHSPDHHESYRGNTRIKENKYFGLQEVDSNALCLLDM